MRNRRFHSSSSRATGTVAALAILASCGGEPEADASQDPAPQQALQAGEAFPSDPAEPRLANLRMLTNGGENAEAYFSADGTRLIFQATRPGEADCDQIYILDLASGDTRQITSEGRTTCAFFFPSGDRILYSSTHEHSPTCPAPPDYRQGYVWPLNAFDIYTAAVDGSDRRLLSGSPGYDAEATISPDGERIVFTSDRDGDLEIYVMDADGSNVTRLTHEPGYDGGPFFSPDGTRIVYRAHHPASAEELADYRRLLEADLVRPTTLDIWVMDADGSNKRRVTDNRAANFAPFFHPDGQRIIFSSNLHDPTSRNFDLYLIGVDGSGLERVTVHGDFDGFPMFSPDGRRLVFASNRGAAREGETNVFLADWVEDLPEQP